MEHKILVINSKETFITVTLKKNLKDEGYTVYSCEPGVQEISAYHGEVKIYIYYIDDMSSANVDVAVFLKDISVEEGNMVILMGAEEGFEKLEKVLPRGNVTTYFPRPIDMHKFIAKMKELTDAKEIENRKKSILIVDDDITFLKMIHSWLKERYRVSIVNSGMKAITWLAKNHADLMILDYEMPVADGPSILEMLKSEIGTNSIPVFFLTGKSDIDSINKAIGLRPERYLLKSIGRDALLEEIDKFFIEKITMKH